MLASGKFFQDLYEDGSQELGVDLKDAKIGVKQMTAVLRFTEISAGFTPKISKPLKNKENMLQCTAPVFAAYTEEF